MGGLEREAHPRVVTGGPRSPGRARGHSPPAGEWRPTQGFPEDEKPHVPRIPAPLQEKGEEGREEGARSPEPWGARSCSSATDHRAQPTGHRLVPTGHPAQDPVSAPARTRAWRPQNPDTPICA